MVGCSIYGCKSRSEKQDSITFHAFPKNAFSKILWIQATGRSNWTPTIFSKICSKHFEENAIVRRKKISRILPTAIPTKNLPKVPKKQVPLAKVKDYPNTRKGAARAARRALMVKRRKMTGMKQHKKATEQSGEQEESVVPSDKYIDDDDNKPEIPDIERDNLFMYPGIKDVRSLNQDTKSEDDVTNFENYLCSECNEAITRFRYTCVQCSDLDLCGACEADGAHHQHYVLRVPADRQASEVQFVLATIRHHLMKRLDPINESSKEQEQEEDVMSETSEIKMEFESDDDFARKIENANYIHNTDDEETDEADLDDIDPEEIVSAKMSKASEVRGARTSFGLMRITRSTAAKADACTEASTVLNTEMKSRASTTTNTEAPAPILGAALSSKANPKPGAAVNSATSIEMSSGTSAGMRPAANTEVRTGANTGDIATSSLGNSACTATVANTGMCIEASDVARTTMSSSVSNTSKTVSNTGTFTKARIAASSSAKTATSTKSSTTISTMPNNEASNRASPATNAPATTGVNTGANIDVCTAKGALTAVIKTGFEAIIAARTRPVSVTCDAKEAVTNTGTRIASSTASTVALPPAVAKTKILIKRKDIINVKDFNSPGNIWCLSLLLWDKTIM
ncbi:uncharacterized protein LOC115450069 isoform X2 [Manduca sexta]|uniref:uncharacterized protein LOC115450069 isoform X2 n=1 Tax=Manduca sexta TaxID=7130 RepID=UPI0018907E9C|nr:uncharacterized protein LOC115450069 isoform X2 [Manduca sexta]